MRHLSRKRDAWRNKTWNERRDVKHPVRNRAETPIPAMAHRSASCPRCPLVAFLGVRFVWFAIPVPCAGCAVCAPLILSGLSGLPSPSSVQNVRVSVLASSRSAPNTRKRFTFVHFSTPSDDSRSVWIGDAGVVSWWFCTTFTQVNICRRPHPMNTTNLPGGSPHAIVVPPCTQRPFRRGAPAITPALKRVPCRQEGIAIAPA